MNNKKIKVLSGAVVSLFTISLTSSAAAEGTIIQQEKISYEKCLKVITTSENKLSVAPEITNLSDQKRVAVFTLVDGTLTIACDGIEGEVTVSTNTN
ncbi:hypothetical protein OAZ20_04645 [Paracoccaceae bacterium]|nr:hypothetical protein [Paracoccaceae bacterium]